MENILIRNYQDKDLSNYVKFFNYIASRLDISTTSEKEVKIHFQDPRRNPYKNMFVVYRESKFIGYIYLYLDSITETKRVESGIVIHPNYRRKGIGTKLLKTLLNRCNELNISIIDVFTKKDTEAAREFAKKNKFKIERYFYEMRNENLKNIEKVKIPKGITFDKFNSKNTH